VNTDLVLAICGLVMTTGLLLRSANNERLTRRDARDVVEHGSFVAFYTRMRRAGAEQEADPATEDTLRRFAVKVGIEPPYVGRHRGSDPALQSA
jgi:hypothetical protein